MAAVTTFLRLTPKSTLRSYFEQEAFVFDPPVDWAAPEPEIIKPLLRAVDEMTDIERDRLVTVIDRVAGEPYQACAQAAQTITQRLLA